MQPLWQWTIIQFLYRTIIWWDLMEHLCTFGPSGTKQLLLTFHLFIYNKKRNPVSQRREKHQRDGARADGSQVQWQCFVAAAVLWKVHKWPAVGSWLSISLLLDNKIDIFTKNKVETKLSSRKKWTLNQCLGAFFNSLLQTNWQLASVVCFLLPTISTSKNTLKNQRCWLYTLL